MPYSATVLKVMIASPGDVEEERTLVRDVVYEWNSIHSEDRKIVLFPLGWETDSTPMMGGRPQEIINKQILKDCDLLIAVFWTRIGSPTGKAPSGTVEEIEEHVSSEKPAMLYFSSVPVRPDSIDREQYNQLREFKAQCQAKALVVDYESLTDFRQKVTRHLAQTVIRWMRENSQ
ncbi:MAG: hypothetical protein WD065_19570 [Planctomycetaceae bacterium]